LFCRQKPKSLKRVGVRKYFVMKKLEFYEMSAINGGSRLGCALAIAGTIAATAGAAIVTGGASLIIFLASKGIATAAVIESCIRIY